MTPDTQQEGVMPDTPTSTSDGADEAPSSESATADVDPDRGAKSALVKEREARKTAEQALADTQRQLQELTDRDKSEADRLRDQLAAVTKERDDAQQAAIRHEVAAEKGLTPAQAKRLVGASREELEADADEILEAFPTKGATSPPPTQRPTADLSGGLTPSEPATEMDPAKLAESLPRF